MKKWKIGFRTIKTAVGAGLAIAFAQLLGLQFYISVAAITMLCVQTSRKRSFQVARDRFLACSLVLLIATGFFALFGFHPWTITFILVLAIPILVRMKLEESVMMSTVLMFHLYTVQDISVSFFLNELALLSIGILFGLFVNLYMPHPYKKLTHYQEKIEKNFQKILSETAQFVRRGESDWDGSEILETVELLKKAKELSIVSLENNPEEKEKYFYRYFRMRRRQFHILERMLLFASRIPQETTQAEKIAEYLETLANCVHDENTSDSRSEELREILKDFKHQPLPTNYHELESRSNLLQLVYEMEQYLEAKQLLNQKEDADPQQPFSERLMVSEDL